MVSGRRIGRRTGSRCPIRHLNHPLLLFLLQQPSSSPSSSMCPPVISLPYHLILESKVQQQNTKSSPRKNPACMDAVDKRQVTHLSTQEGTCPNHPLHHADHCHPHLHTFAPSLPPLHHHNQADLPEMVETSRLWVSAGAVVRECGLFSPLCSTAAQCTQLLSTVLQK